MLSAVLLASLCASLQNPRTPKLICDAVLVPQSDGGGCVSSGNPDCGGTGETCCRHFHAPLNWHRAVHWPKFTGMMKGPSVKKYYTAQSGVCVLTTCNPGVPVQDLLHYQDDDSLLSCGP